MKKFFNLLFLLLLSSHSYWLQAQSAGDPINLSYTNPEKFEIGGITVSGVQFLDPEALISITGLKIGDKITVPGDDIANAIKKLWDQGLIGDVEVSATKTGGLIYLDFLLKERPRLSRFVFKGVKKKQEKELNEKIDIARGRIVNDAMIKNAQRKIMDFFLDKGYLNATVNIVQEMDKQAPNNILLKATINRGDKVKIKNIIFKGNESFPDKKLRKKMKKTKQKRLSTILSSSKLIRSEFENDKKNIIDFYNAAGYRDAAIVSDSTYRYNEKFINLEIKIEEGNKYYFRDIDWTGNFIHSDKTLDAILNIKKGDVYNMANLEKKLNFNPAGMDISSLYLDDGYLFFSIDPVEVLVEGDSIDIEMRINEGTQATIRNVTVSGNTKTHDHVILREIRTLPGQKFSRSDLIRSQREIAALGYFNPETIGINPIPDPQKGVVDIHYTVEEKPSDQIELSGGWGGFFGFVGTLGVVFNNFSVKNIRHPKTWSPLPAGDGQRLAIRFQANGRSFQTYSLSFTEPWLGGKKPQSFSASLSHSVQNRYNPETGKYRGGGSLQVTGVTLGLGRRLKWPDDYFTLNNSLSLMRYKLDNYISPFGAGGIGFDSGYANNINFTTTISRNSLDEFTFPTRGSSMSLSVALTPPYSLFSKQDRSALPPEKRFEYIEYHKWMLDNSWFATIIPGKKRNLVLNVRAHLGFIGAYKKSTGVGPFERFIMGGDGLSGFNFLLGSDIIGLRGYQNNSISPTAQGGVIFDKFVAELRYPISMSPSFSVFILGFVEAGNNWSSFRDFNPFEVYRSAGFGTRIFMPAFGMIGIDWGYGFDKVPGFPGPGSKVTFTIGQQIR